LPAMAGGLSHDGTLYAAPFYGESSMVMYRTDLMALPQQKFLQNFLVKSPNLREKLDFLHGLPSLKAVKFSPEI
jgi:ABC-type glycerol-3-phosphate transport system substrate-binding protein